MRKYLLFFLFVQKAAFSLSVTVVGGGPAGLASAIEASSKGFKVTLVEKRNSYSRNRPIALLPNVLKILKEWNLKMLEIPMCEQSKQEASKWSFSGDESFTSMQRIDLIEKKLIKKCEELGVDRICGDFQRFGSEQTVYVKTEDGERVFSYDILIGADGLHSKVRELLSIQMNDLGFAKAAYLVLPFSDFGMASLKMILIMKKDFDFLRIIKVLPFVTIISAQSSLEGSKDRIKDLLEAFGWTKEFKAIEEGKDVECVEDIFITLSQAETFSSFEKSVVLLGDAVASGSFLLGIGLNTAILSKEILGEFLIEWKEDKEKAFQNFNRSMKGITDKLIECNKSLFREF